MKKLFFMMAAVAALLTSCSKDDTLGGPARGKVTFEVSTPELATRYGEGTTATNLRYAVYDMVEDTINGTFVKEGTTNLSGLKATVTIDLVEGRQYEVAFWAESENSPYTFDARDKTVRYTNIEDLDANMEDYDAFFAYVNEDKVVVGSNVSVTLKRPFAQLNIATNDTEKGDDDVYKALGVQVKTTGIEVKIYTSLNLATGAVDGEQTLTFTPAEIEKGTIGEIEAAGKTYNQLSMNYLLVSEKKNIDVKFKFTDTNNKAYERSYTSVPVQRNHRTNILGKVLTDPTAFYVDINPDMDDPTYVIGDYLVGETYYTVLADAVTAAIEANEPLELVQDAWYDADDPIVIPANKSLTINLNGHTLCGVTDDDDVAYLFDVQGTLIVNGAVPMRAADNTDGAISFEHKSPLTTPDGAGIFCVTGKGSLTVNNSLLDYVGGSDKGYAIDLFDADQVSLTVENSTLLSSVVPVRVANNSGETSVTISSSELEGGNGCDAFFVENNSDDALGNLTLDIFGADNNDFNGDISFGSGDSSFTANPETGVRKNAEGDDTNIYWNSYCCVRSWEEFTAALGNYAKVILSNDITYDANYQLQKDVVIDLNDWSMTLPMINIHTKTTIKNGTINGKVYARKNSVIVFDKVTFSGAVADNLSTEGHLAIQGGCTSLYAKDCLFSPTSVSGSQTKPLSFEGGSTIMKFENCEFKSSPYKKQVYLNSLSAAGSLDFTNCNFNYKTPNIMFAATCPLTNVTMSGTTKLSSVTFEINRAKEAVTDADLAYLRELIANNSFSSVRVFYDPSTSEYIR